MPPRSKWALKKFSEPDVAIAAEAEISSASVAAATIWAKRYTLPAPAQSIRPSQARAYGNVVPPPTVPTSKPGSRIDAFSPPSTRFPVVTGRIFLRYRRPVPINNPLSVRAFIEEERGRRVYVRGELWHAEELLAEARLAFVHVPLKHFLETPEGREHAAAWRKRLEAEQPSP